MLAENLVEEFEMKDDEPWYDHRDLQQDLQLAAELGKTLLDRNTELEDSLQQMYTTNQEQLQEIEYLTKQVDLLRQMNEQHAKVYEQLDVTARDLEETNQKLVADSKASQQKILSLTETIECLQTNIDHLQSQVEELKSSSQGRRRHGPGDKEKAAPSFPCPKELYDLRQHFVYDHVFAEKIASLQSRPSPEEEANEHLKKEVAALQAQLDAERQRRAAVKAELGQALRDKCELEQQLGAATACRARARELEAEVAGMRQLLRAERPLGNGLEALLPEPGPSLLDELLPPAPEPPWRPLRRSSSDPGLGSLAGSDIARGHEEMCIRRARPGPQRGVSLLHEVDTQCSALREKYEALLRRLTPKPGATDLAHKAMQTQPWACGWEPGGPPAPTDPPEYKALFEEIFSCIRKTQQEIDEQRMKYRALPSHS